MNARLQPAAAVRPLPTPRVPSPAAPSTTRPSAPTAVTARVLLAGLRAGLWAGLLAVAAGPQAQEAAPDSGPSLDTPQLPRSPVTGEEVEPDITIREEGTRTVYEYRVNGQLYMVRIQPQIGPPYYFLDTDGDGLLDERSDAPTDVSVQQWILFQWR